MCCGKRAGHAGVQADCLIAAVWHPANPPARVRDNGQVFLFEFKVVELNPAGAALQQIKNLHDADQYRSRGEPMHLIGVELSKASGNIDGFECETLAI